MIRQTHTKTLILSAIKKIFGDKTRFNRGSRDQISKEIQSLDARLVKARGLLVDGDIDADDFKAIKDECQSRISVLEEKLLNIPKQSYAIDDLLAKGTELLCNLQTLYSQSSVDRKRKVIGSIFPEKLIFDGVVLRTGRINEAVRLLYTLGDGFGTNENGTNQENPDLSHKVNHGDDLSNLLRSDLKHLYGIKNLIFNNL